MTCGNCAFCYQKDAFEMDGLCKKQCSAEENKNYTYLDSPACKNWQKERISINNCNKKE